MRLDRLARPPAAAATFAIVPPGLLHFFGRDQAGLSGSVHFAAVGGTALAATAAGIALSVAGARRHDLAPRLPARVGRNEAGTLFDRRCVEALERVLGRTPQAVAV